MLYIECMRKSLFFISALIVLLGSGFVFLGTTRKSNEPDKVKGENVKAVNSSEIIDGDTLKLSEPFFYL